MSPRIIKNIAFMEWIPWALFINPEPDKGRRTRGVSHDTWPSMPELSHIQGALVPFDEERRIIHLRVRRLPQVHERWRREFPLRIEGRESQGSCIANVSRASQTDSQDKLAVPALLCVRRWFIKII
jgi:hypothetical protein